MKPAILRQFKLGKAAPRSSQWRHRPKLSPFILTLLLMCVCIAKTTQLVVVSYWETTNLTDQIKIATAIDTTPKPIQSLTFENRSADTLSELATHVSEEIEQWHYSTQWNPAAFETRVNHTGSDIRLIIKLTNPSQMISDITPYISTLTIPIKAFSFDVDTKQIIVEF